MTPLHHAYLLRGWLLDKNPPILVTMAVDAIIAALGAERVELEIKPTVITPIPLVTESEPEQCGDPATEGVAALPDPEPNPVTEPEQPKPRKSAGWSPERRAAQAEVMRATQARKRAQKEGTSSDDAPPPTSPPPVPAKPYTPAPYEKLVSDHGGYAGKRDPGQPLTDDDWPDIKARLAKSPDRRAIASDYDVDPDDLNFFIASCQRREGKPPGEALAPLPNVAGGAARPTW